MVLNEEKRAELEDACASLGLPLTGPAISRSGYPIDIAKPNIHDSKSEFLLEMNAVRKLDEHAFNLVSGLMVPEVEGGEDEAMMRRRVNHALDAVAKNSVHRNPLEGVFDLINETACRQGLTSAVSGLLIELVVALRGRLRDLEEQERVFWTLKNRHPNHYARTIALRLAKRYAETHGKKPTVGTSRDGGHPSTDYCRAMERIFATLDIDAKVIHPAKWAVGQLQESDLRTTENVFQQYALAGEPVPNALAMGNGQGQPEGILNHLAQLSRKGAE